MHNIMMLWFAMLLSRFLNRKLALCTAHWRLQLRAACFLYNPWMGKRSRALLEGYFCHWKSYHSCHKRVLRLFQRVIRSGSFVFRHYSDIIVISNVFNKIHHYRIYVFRHKTSDLLWKYPLKFILLLLSHTNAQLHLMVTSYSLSASWLKSLSTYPKPAVGRVLSKKAPQSHMSAFAFAKKQN